MQTLEQIRKSIESAQDLGSVAKTMKTLAAVEIRELLKVVNAVTEYNRTVELGFQILMMHRPEGIQVVPSVPVKHAAVVVLGSDQGMCGRFNEQLAKFSLDLMKRERLPSNALRFFVAGERLLASFEALQQPVAVSFSVPTSVHGISALVEEILLRIGEWEMQTRMDAVFIFHNTPQQGYSYRPKMVRALPLDQRWLNQIEQAAWATKTIPSLTMEWNRLLSSLVQQYLFVSFYRTVAESRAAENGARFSAMQLAENNINDRLEGLNAEMRQKRQRVIEDELFDVVSGFETLTHPKSG